MTHPLRRKPKRGPKAAPPPEPLEDAARILEALDTGAVEAIRPEPAPRRIPRSQTNDFVRRAQTGDVDARNAIVRSHMGIVHYAVQKYRDPLVAHEDAVQLGVLGLMRAIETFEPDRGTVFSTYAVLWIRSKVQRRAGSREDRGAPVYGPGVGRRRSAVIGYAQLASLDAPLVIDDDCNIALGETVAARDPTPEEAVIAAVERARVRRALDAIAVTLNGGARMRAIIDERILAEEPLGLEELGARFGVSKEAIRLIEKKVLDRLKLALGREVRPYPPAAATV